MATPSTPERLVFATSTHWVKYLHTILINHLFLFFGIALTGIAVVTSRSAPAVTAFILPIGAVLILITHHLFFHKLLSESMLDIIVTDERVIYFDDCLFTCDDEHEIPLKKIAAVEVKQHGLAQNILDYGILWFDTGGGNVDLRRSIPHVPHPDAVAAAISRTTEGAKNTA